ncbi:MAG: zinc-ribbon domain-containing protein [Thermodesulfobacteriota bacterium]|nr:zinc-ribbon domain-containing protein [Thermodesulfobacteriota bacterium]
MKVECSNCNKEYKIPDEKPPVGKKFAVQCPACKNRIVINLRSTPKHKKSLQAHSPVEKGSRQYRSAKSVQAAPFFCACL